MGTRKGSGRLKTKRRSWSASTPACLTGLPCSTPAPRRAAVAPGGLLVYAVCSTDPEEGADQVELFLRSHPDFTAEPATVPISMPTWQGHLRTLPGPEGWDGFFAARLRRSA